MRSPLSGHRGFTLMEVLVATAITGIAIGVFLSGIAQSHRQAFRGGMAREAARIAEDLLFTSGRDPEILARDQGDIKGHPGWSYGVETAEPTVLIDGEEMDAREILEMTISIQPPEDAPPFILTTWIRRPDEER